MNRRRVAVVGLGMALPPHIESLAALGERVEIALCCSTSKAHREAFVARYPYPVANRIDPALEDPGIEIVFLLTPPSTHLDLVRRCAAAGKHVLLEKPIEVSPERAEVAVAAMERVGRRFAIGLQNRFRAGFRRLAALLRAGELGDLLCGAASIRCWRPPEYFAELGRGTRARDGGGVLLVQAIHTLDLFQKLCGPVARVAAFAATSPLRPIDTEDMVGVAIEFASGAIGTIDATTVAYPGFSERIELACNKASAVLAGETLEVFYKNGRQLREEGPFAPRGAAARPDFMHYEHKAMINDFLDAIENEREPAVSGREALAVQRLIAALLRSSEERRIVELAPC
jgi:predicted dehydrogenase